MRRKDCAKGLILLLIIAMIITAPAWGWHAQEKEAQEKSPGGTSHSSIASAKDLGSAFVEVAKKVKPSVVSIRVERSVAVPPWRWFGEDFFKGTPFEDFFRFRSEPPGRRRQIGGGSGVIVDPKGYILTNHHVVAGADRIIIRLSDGREKKGTVQGSDPKTDLAVVNVEAKNLPVAILGDSDKIEVGGVGNRHRFSFRAGGDGYSWGHQCEGPNRTEDWYLRRLHPDRCFY